MKRTALTVGVTPRWLSRHDEYFLSFSEDLLSYLSSEIGCEVVPLTPHNKDHFEKCDVLLLSGGESISMNLPRDSFERSLLTTGLKQKKKVIGICRGMQLIATHFGSNLEKVDGHVSTVSTIRANKTSLEFKASCYHSQRVSEMPVGFQMDFHNASDGTIEAFSNHQLNIYACMWHPEREQSTSTSRRIFTQYLTKS